MILRNTASIWYVMKGGRLYDGDTLDDVWPDVRPYGRCCWVHEDMLRSDNRPMDYEETDVNTAVARSTGLFVLPRPL